VIYLDTSGIYAAIDSLDPHHAQAAKTFVEITQSEERLVTTNYVVTELIALTQRRIGHKAVRAITEALLSAVDVALVDESLHEAAMNLFLAESRRHLSLVDCSSVVYMRRNGITQVFTLDSGFKRFGFELL
jgi:predicted nucleic acid-binding protein